MMEIKLSGVEPLKRWLKQTASLEWFEDELEEAGDALKEDIQARMDRDYDEGYATGESRDSVFTSKDENRLRVGATTPQAFYQEVGTPTMKAQPVFEPARREYLEKLEPNLKRRLEP